MELKAIGKVTGELMLYILYAVVWAMVMLGYICLWVLATAWLGRRM